MTTKIEDILIARFAASYRFGGSTNPEPVSVAKASWSGLYAGGHFGYAHVEFDSLFDGSEISNPFDNEDSVLGRFFELDGGVGGIQVGYNQSHGRIVYGAEADWTSLRKSDLLFDPDSGNGNDDFASVDLHWMATLRGRIGMTSANTLFFATAGVAWIKGDYSAVDNSITEGKVSVDDVGFVLGGGIEHALTSKHTHPSRRLAIQLRKRERHKEFDSRFRCRRLCRHKRCDRVQNGCEL